jgi:hypothetical protein
MYPTSGHKCIWKINIYPIELVRQLCVEPIILKSDNMHRWLQDMLLQQDEEINAWKNKKEHEDMGKMKKIDIYIK